MEKLTVGFPRMHKEAGEVRDFLPRLIHRIAPRARKVVLEKGVGSGMETPPGRYVEDYPNVRFGSNQEAYDQDIVVQLRSPDGDELARMKPGTILFSMLHYPTHPKRIKLILDLGLRAISMDSVVDDDGRRLVEDLRGTSWNSVWAGFRALQKSYPPFSSPERPPLRVVSIGAGEVGRHAAEAATKYGDVILHRALLKRDVPGVIVQTIGRNITQSHELLRDLLSRADVLIDSTFRSDPTRYIVSNELVGALPEHAVIVDITADPYVTESDPIQVKAIEGIPSGNLDEYEFPPDHPVFDQLPPQVSAEHRRMTVSCYSWPGLKPKYCMQRYGRQMGWMLDILLYKPYDALSDESRGYFERALYRGTLDYYLRQQEAMQESHVSLP